MVIKPLQASLTSGGELFRDSTRSFVFAAQNSLTAHQELLGNAKTFHSHLAIAGHYTQPHMDAFDNARRVLKITWRCEATANDTRRFLGWECEILKDNSGMTVERIQELCQGLKGRPAIHRLMRGDCFVQDANSVHMVLILFGKPTCLTGYPILRLDEDAATRANYMLEIIFFIAEAVKDPGCYI